MSSNEECVVIDEANQKPQLVASAEDLRRMLQIIEDDILPKTRKGVSIGNKVFGAAILNNDLSVAHADTNEETTCPMFHGEVKTIIEWSKKVEPSIRGPSAQRSVFLSTHEPCCMCISTIVWTGFTKVFYLFPYSITSDQGIPHDIQTMHELWGVPTYRKQNRYLSTACLMDLIQDLEDSTVKDDLLQKQQNLIDAYARLSDKYHVEKVNNDKNSLVLG